MPERDELRDSDEDEKQEHSCSGGKIWKKVKYFVSSRFRRTKKLCRRKQSSSTDENVVSKGCCFFFKLPRASDSAARSQPHEMNPRECTHQFVRSLIEKNDFYSKECNPHIELNS